MKLIQIKDYEDYYFNEDLNIVTSLLGKQRVLKPSLNKRGYYQIVLLKDKKRKTLLIHRLISIQFISNENDKPCVNHINGIKTDNRLNNLEWCTYSENNQHALDNGLRVTAKGNNHGMSKLNEILVIKIRDQFNKGESVDSITKKYNVNKPAIYKIVTNKTWRHLL